MKQRIKKTVLLLFVLITAGMVDEVRNPH